MSSNEVCFYDLGLIEYREAHRIMLNLLQKRIANEIGDTVLLLEHFDVYTLGEKGRGGECNRPNNPGIPC
jgi:lipoyl(octanoyl) transferase